MNKYLVKIVSIFAVSLGCLILLNLSACGKKGPLYLENQKKPPTQETTKNKTTENSSVNLKQ